jgi:hypothetical protein
MRLERILLFAIAYVFLFHSSFAQTDPTQSYKSDPITYAYPKKKIVSIDPIVFGECLALNTKANSQSKIQPAPAKNGIPYSEKYFKEYLISSTQKDFSTGQEKNLETWILKQSDNSIDPLTLFNASMQLNNQNAWTSMVTIYGLLRSHARWWTQPQQVKFTPMVYGEITYENKKVPDFSYIRSTHVFNKLIDIRGDLRERGTDFEGDHKGTWYRIWGMMLYRISQNKDFPDFHHVDNDRTLGLVESFKAFLSHISSVTIGYGIELEKQWFHDTEKDTRKAEINRAAAIASTTYLLALYEPGELESSSSLTYKDCTNRAYLTER